MESDLCPVCKVHKESVMHALWQCVASSDVWTESSARVQKWSIMEESLMDLIEKMAQNLTTEEMEEVAVVMWRIWLRRNQLVFENSFMPPKQLINIAREQLREFQMAQVVAEHPNPIRGLMGQVGWVKPTAGSVKVNWDAALDQKKGKAGFGIVIRDEKGEVLTACCDQRPHVQNPAIAECDAQTIVKAVNEEMPDFPCYGSIVLDVKKLLEQQVGWKIQYIHRSSNGAAHSLAKEALKLDTEVIWMEETPACIAECIEIEKDVTLKRLLD
ncbi:hypothetical protein I3760_09G152300 [Carya illinoinensis]|nr:hypothetical protein I3760_09G152300 [Carya illinoinensis]